MKKINNKQGFTLIELLVVLIILGLLAGLVGPQIFGNVDKAKVQTAETQVKSLKTAIQTLRLDIGRIPTEEEGLRLLIQRPSDEKASKFWRGPYIEEQIPLDPWNNPYQYNTTSSGLLPFSLYSFGADGKSGGAEYDQDIGYVSTSE